MRSLSRTARPRKSRICLGIGDVWSVALYRWTAPERPSVQRLLRLLQQANARCAHCGHAVHAHRAGRGFEAFRTVHCGECPCAIGEPIRIGEPEWMAWRENR